MNKLEFNGVITEIGEVQVISDNFKKRILVVTNSKGKYDEIGVFYFKNDGCDKLNNYKIGQSVNVKFNLQSRNHNSKWYMDAMAWDINNFMDTPKETPREANEEPFTTDNLPI